MSKVFKCNLYSERSIHDLINQLQYYKGNELEMKCKLVTEELAKMGYDVATHYKDLNGMGKHITITWNTNLEIYGSTTYLIATENEPIIATWVRHGVEISAEVSPLLMAEYGSGLKARPKQEVGGVEVGQGTFPEQTHANDPNGWWWKDKEDKWHHSYGLEPTMPMYMSMIEMFSNANKVVKNAFRS